MSILAVRAARLGLAWRDVALALALAVAAFALRLPFQAEALYAWDSVLYARALDGFNVVDGRPHPPGYLFYVGLARAIEALVGDPNRSLVLASLLGGALAVGLLALLGRLLVGWPAALVAAALLAASPLFWFYSEVAYPYTVLAAGAIALALLAWQSAQGRWPGPVALGLALGVAGGFRLDLTLFLLPLALWAALRRALALAGMPAVGRKLLPPLDEVHSRQFTVDRVRADCELWTVDCRLVVGSLFALGLGLALGSAAWYLPTALLSNGLEAYTRALLGQADYVEGNYSLASHGLLAVQRNGGQVIAFTWQALGLALVPAGYALARGRGHPAAPWLALWLGPPLVFYSLVHIGDRGYIFSYLPALCLAAGWGTLRLGHDLAALAQHWLPLRRAQRPRHQVQSPGRPGLSAFNPGLGLGSVLAAALVGAAAFQFLADRGRYGAYELQCFSRATNAAVEHIRSRFPPEQTLVFSSFYYQHTRYLLPAYPAWHFDPVSGPLFERPLPPQVVYVVVFGEDVGVTLTAPNLTSLPLPCGRRLYVYRVDSPEARLLYHHQPPWLYVGK
ncbi:MAG: DUF2723 domain-containing protein [Chloroflexi bacterium]|nr:DUF2723 domain-containing protein [Chloroflexota bacterium]